MELNSTPTEAPLPETPPKPERKRTDMPGPMPTMRGILAWAAILALLLMMAHLAVQRQSTLEVISYYPRFVELVEQQKLKKCEVVREVSGQEYIRGEYMTGDSQNPLRRFRVELAGVDEGLRKFLIDNHVEFKVEQQNPYVWSLVSSVLPVLLIFGLLYFVFMRQIRAAGHSALSFGKSRAKMLNRDTNKVTFANVAGIDEAKEEVQEIIEFLKDPKRFQTLGGRIPKGVLLMGPPGTGKTLLAKAIAGEADVPFFSISGSDFVEMFVGVGASRVRDMFEQGKRNAPCIIFIDEIDAVGRSRFSGIGGGHDEREQTLNALLVQMDGFETQEGVIIIAATNRPDVLDQALLRPGRFDRQVVIDLPMIEGRLAILNMHAGKIKLAKAAELRVIARGTPGFSGADLANLLNEGALLAARKGKAAVDMRDLEEARDKVKWGRERRSRVLGEKDKRITAYHEAGHALVMQLVEESEPLHKITIIPRGVAYLGATMQLPEKDRYMEGRKDLQGMLAGLMGGRAAEELIFGDITSGASSDLKEATRIVRLMVCSWGMSAELGPQTFGEHQELLFLGRDVTRTQDYSEDTSRRIDVEINRVLREAHGRAKSIVTEHREKLCLIAELLLERETLDGREVKEIIEHNRLLSDAERGQMAADKADTETAAAAATPVTGELALSVESDAGKPATRRRKTPPPAPTA
jgi:cell division protease FtsH